MAAEGAHRINLSPAVVGLAAQLLRINVKRFRGGLVVKAHRLVYHSTLGLGVIKKKVVGLTASERDARTGYGSVQGYLAHKKTPTPL